jgi:flagellar biosynthesis protein FlhF
MSRVIPQLFRGRDIQRVSRAVRAELGDDAMIVRTRIVRDAERTEVEVVAAAAAEVEELRSRVAPAPLHRAVVRRRRRPLVIALVGPGGGGKSTTLVKLAMHGEAFGRWKVGLLTLDTFRVGAREQLADYAAIAGIPLEAAYQPEEVREALERLADREVVLVDTPAHTPRDPERNARWMELLAAARPHEVHLVAPVMLRLEVAAGLPEALHPLRVTHLLPTRLDEAADEATLAELALQLALPARWVTDGCGLPGDLHAAPVRILEALGDRARVAAERVPA